MSYQKKKYDNKCDCETFQLHLFYDNQQSTKKLLHILIFSLKLRVRTLIIKEKSGEKVYTSKESLDACAE